ncbi:MAG: CBS domain-containing protein [Woeseiaceae bacterium]
MKLVKHLLDTKGRHIISISPDASVLDAITLMADKSIGSLLVMGDDEKLLGIVTERDYARKVIVKGRSSRETRVSEIMTTEVMTATLDNRVDQCMELMTNRKVRHLPVVDDNQVIGLISIGDLVQAIIADQQEEIQHLEHYISG